MNYILLCYFIVFMASPERDKVSLQSKGKDRRRGRRNTLLYFKLLLGVARPVLLELQLAQNLPTLIILIQVPDIFRDADPKFKTLKQVMSELSQYHPELRVSRVKDLPNKGIIGNTPRDVLTLQSKNKMKACLGQNLEISPPKAYQINEKARLSL